MVKQKTMKQLLVLFFAIISFGCTAQTYSTGTPKTIKAAWEIQQRDNALTNYRIDSIIALLKDNPAPEPPIDSSAKGTQLFGKFLGVNQVHEDKTEWSSPLAGTVRLYTNRDWFEGDIPGDVLRFQNSRGGWYFDDAYKKFKDAGQDIMMCFQLPGLQKPNRNDKPTNSDGLSTTDPKSYTKFASTCFQVAARYGSVKHSNLRSDDKLSGLSLIKYLEVLNEPDKRWEGPNAYFSPEEYAAVLSVCYDSIKKADPNIIVVAAGMSEQKLDYFKRMNAWFQANRPDKKFAADVINVHIYALSNSIDWNNPPWPLPMGAETPEDGKFYEKMKPFVEYARSIGKQFFVSEFGWDTHPESPLCPKSVAGADVQELQARYLIRAFMEFAAAGVDAAQQYELVDPSQEQWGGGLYGTSGYIKRDDNLSTANPTKKKSWFAVQEMKQTLGEYKFNRIVRRDSEAHIYEFVKGSDKIYAAWLPTSVNASKDIHVSGRLITLTEKPIFIL